MMRIAIAAAALVLAASGCMTQKARAPVDDRRPTAGAPKPLAVEPALAPTPATPPPATYTVKRGDTLYSIALELGIDYRELARWNNLDDATKIRVGQALRIVPSEEDSAVQIGAARVPGALEARPLEGAAPPPAPGAQPQPQAKGDAAMKTSPKALRLPYSDQNLAQLSKGEAQVAAPKPVPVPVAVEPRPEPAKPAERDPDAIDFIWPVRGRVLAAFAEPNSKGVDISGKIGDPVVAAAQGKVMYTGTGIRGYGKLIVIKHDNGFNSVYAHNREILVKEGQNVTRGQKIAELGDSDADAPKLHFEIRKSGKPVDPMRYLPPG